VPLPLAAVALVGGLALLVRAADEFVAGAEAIALQRGWSRAVIGAVIVGFGTSLPELVTSVLAAFGGEADLALGNAAGSNVANLLLILGVAAVVAPIVGGREQAPRRDGLIAGAASVLLLLAAVDGRVGALEGLVLVAALLGSLAWQVLGGRDTPAAGELPLPVPVSRVGVRVIGGLLGVLVGAQLLVSGATAMAAAAGVPPIVVGSVLVAVGTSLPELATAIASARRGQVELLLGNLLGSNAFNATMVVGASALVAGARGTGFPVETAALVVVVAAAIVTVGAAVWLGRRPVVSRLAGGVLIGLHVASVPALLAVS
jgi:cation:H+ antiporter